jgi:hypothetical protein
MKTRSKGIVKDNFKENDELEEDFIVRACQPQSFCTVFLLNTWRYALAHEDNLEL